MLTSRQFKYYDEQWHLNLMCLYSVFIVVSVISQTYFSVNNDMQQRGNILNYDLVQCDGVQTLKNCLKMAK
jgi:hypothetical protein